MIHNAELRKALWRSASAACIALAPRPLLEGRLSASLPKSSESPMVVSLSNVYLNLVVDGDVGEGVIRESVKSCQ